MILDCKKTATYISNWLKDYANKNGIKGFVYGLSGGVDSALVALLCKKTGLPTLAVNMPCHSSETAFNRADAFAKEYDLPFIKVDLSSAHESIFNQAKNLNHSNFEPENRIAVGGLRSCLRAPLLSYYANAMKFIICGTGNRSEDHITRYFQKYGDGCVDVSPISDLFKSEVYQLFAYLAQEMNPSPFEPIVVSRGIDISCMKPAARDIFEANPTADLWGPNSGQEDEKELGITYDEVEWADREDIRTEKPIIDDGESYIWAGIIFNCQDPVKHPNFFLYTSRQREVICKLHQMEKISRHKVNPNLPMCKVRDVEGLVQ